MTVRFQWRVKGQTFVRTVKVGHPSEALQVPYLKERGACEVEEVHELDGRKYWLVRSKFNLVLAVITKE